MCPSFFAKNIVLRYNSIDLEIQGMHEISNRSEITDLYYILSALFCSPTVYCVKNIDFAFHQSLSPPCPTYIKQVLHHGSHMTGASQTDIAL